MSDKKKICIISTVSLTMKAFILETATKLRRENNCDVTLICSPDEDFLKILPSDIKFIPIQMVRGIDIKAIASIYNFYRVFKREKFDMIQYCTPNASCYASIAGWMTQIPKRLYCQWGIYYVGLAGIRRTVFKWVEKLICTLSTHVRGQSRKNINLIINDGICNPDKIGLVGIGGTVGVSIEECDSIPKAEQRIAIRNKYQIPENAFVYGFVGRLNKDKGIDELIEAFRKISENNSNSYLMLVGPIEDKNSISPSSKKWIQSHPRIVHTGYVSAGDVYVHMCAFDLLVHPTYREGFGKVIQEAMGMKIPVLTTDIPGPSEVIENNVSGLLAQVRNVEDLSHKMSILHKDQELRERLAKNGRLRAETFFDRPIMLKNSIADFLNILHS